MASQGKMDTFYKVCKNGKNNAKGFYGKPASPEKIDTLVPRSRHEGLSPPTVKKLITLSSDDSDSDSDIENTVVKRKSPVERKEERDSSSDRSVAKLRKIEPKIQIQKGTRSRQQSKSTTTPFGELNLSTENTSKTIRKNLFSDKYHDARKALHSSTPDNMLGREKEMQQLDTFVSEHFNSGISGSLYLSGPPGTGKTACLSQINPKLHKNLRKVYVNCTSIKSANAIYAKILKELKIKVDKTVRDCKAVVEKYLFSTNKRRKMLLLVLDEMDNLESKNQSVLYTIFEWPSIPMSKLILIGIANALDLTDRILPRLQARCEIKPQVMNFAPYTNDQIITIITDRLHQANVTEVFTKNALNLLARKVSAMSGDIRKALDICRRLIEHAESQRNLLVLRNPNNETKSRDSTAIAQVDVMEVVNILQAVYGGSQNIDEEESTFPIQQKVLLCSLMLMLNKGKNKDITIGRLYNVYRKVCTKRNINILDTPEFVSVCSLIETRGIIRVVAKKDSRLSKVNLEWDQDQLTSALKDKNLMSDIINDVSCL